MFGALRLAFQTLTLGDFVVQGGGAFLEARFEVFQTLRLHERVIPRLQERLGLSLEPFERQAGHLRSLDSPHMDRTPTPPRVSSLDRMRAAVAAPSTRASASVPRREAPSRTTGDPTSARNTAWDHADAPASTVTSPIRQAGGATKAGGWTMGALPSKEYSGTAPT